jgi:hypothetical protein
MGNTINTEPKEVGCENVHHIPLDVDVNLNEDKRKKTGWIK